MRLLVNLLEHEVGIARLFCLARGPGHGLGRALHRLSVKVRDAHPIADQVCDVAVLQEDDLAGLVQDRRGVGGEEHLALAHSEHEGRGLLDRDDFVRVAIRQDRDGV